MKAAVFHNYGGPEQIRIEDIPAAAPEPDQVLVRIQAASVNALDWHRLRGKPYLVRLAEGLTRPKNTQLGADLAGTVEAVGAAVTRFVPGDEVMGMGIRTLAEFAVVTERGLVPKPANVSFEHAAAASLAALTALQGLRDKGRIGPDQRVLINGAAGGVGHVAVQIARIVGAEVTAVTSTPNLELVRSLGAAHVIDYTTTDFTRSGEQYDLILDLGGNRRTRDLRTALTSFGTLVLCGAPRGDWVGPLVGPAGAALASRFSSQRITSFLAHRELADLEQIARWLASGELAPVIDRTYALDAAADAIADLEAGHVAGKLVLRRQ